MRQALIALIAGSMNRREGIFKNVRASIPGKWLQHLSRFEWSHFKRRQTCRPQVLGKHPAPVAPTTSRDPGTG